MWSEFIGIFFGIICGPWWLILLVIIILAMYWYVGRKEEKEMKEWRDYLDADKK